VILLLRQIGVEGILDAMEAAAVTMEGDAEVVEPRGPETELPVV
jgi:hypothetical protein